jgi:hypothetical protein
MLDTFAFVSFYFNELLMIEEKISENWVYKENFNICADDLLPDLKKENSLRPFKTE